MAQVINTNISSLNAQRNLNASQSSLATSLQRLSTGLRINSAKDDAAGLAITDRMTSQVRGLNQAARNANDGISLSQTAESGLSEVGANLQRMRELAVQSANATNTASDRKALNAEVQELLKEIQRVSTTTQFNGQNILDGTFTAAQFQVGANANQTIIASTGNSQTDAIGSYQFQQSTVKASAGIGLVAGDLLINGVDVGKTSGKSAESIAAAINNISPKTGVNASARTEVASSTSALNVPLRNQALKSGDLLINGINIGSTAANSNVADQGKAIAAAINNVTSKTGVTAIASAATGQLTLTSATGKSIELTTANGDDGATRVENATGLEMAGAGKAMGTSTLTFESGTIQKAVVTFKDIGSVSGVTSSHQNALNTLANKIFTVGGKTFRFVESVASGSAADEIAISETATTLGDNIRTALLAARNNGSLNDVTWDTTAGAAAVTLSAGSVAFSNGRTDGVLRADTTATNVSSWATTDGVGVRLGDTINVGGVIYEFGLASQTEASVKGNVLVKLGMASTHGSTNTELSQGTARSIATAISEQYNQGKGTMSFNKLTGTDLVVNLNHTLYGGTDVVAAPTEVKSDGTASYLKGATADGFSGTYSANTTHGKISLFSPTNFSISGNTPSNAGLSDAVVNLMTIDKIDISSVEGANDAISLIDGALAQVASTRADLGALQNRFSSVVSSLNATSENLSAARSRIQDADFAQETAALTRAQILQQAGIAMLSQANALPQNVLSLLK